MHPKFQTIVPAWIKRSDLDQLSKKVDELFYVCRPMVEGDTHFYAHGMALNSIEGAELIRDALLEDGIDVGYIIAVNEHGQRPAWRKESLLERLTALPASLVNRYSDYGEF